MPATTAKAKNDNYMSIFRLITTLAATILALQPDDTEEALLQLFLDFESNFANFKDRLGFFTTFRSKLSTFRTRHEEVMHRPPVFNAFNAAMLQETAYNADLLVLTPTGYVPVAHGDFATTFWPLYRSNMLGQEETEWQHIHRHNFGNSDKNQGTRTLADWYEEEFAKPALVQFRCPVWPTGAADWGTSLTANIMVATVDPYIHAMLFADPVLSLLVAPANMKTWDSSAIYQAFRTISNSGVYKASVVDRDKLTLLNGAIQAQTAVHDNIIAAIAKATTFAQQPQQASAIKSATWDELTLPQRNEIHAKYQAMELANPVPVPGANGKIDLNAKGQPQWCFRWSDDSGCHHRGHRMRNCPNGCKPPPQDATPPKADPVLPSAAPHVPMALSQLGAIDQSTLKDLFAALADIGGTDSDVAAIAKKYTDT